MFRRTLNIFLELLTSYLFTLMSFFFQSVLTRSLHFSVLEILCCSIFKDHVRPTLARRSIIISHISKFVKHFLEKILHFISFLQFGFVLQFLFVVFVHFAYNYPWRNYFKKLLTLLYYNVIILLALAALEC